LLPTYQDNWTTLYQGDCRAVLAELSAESVNCVVTSPPYFNLRDYGTAKWEGGSSDCDHSPEKREPRFSTPVSSKQGSNAGSGTASRRDCSCGATRVDSQIGLEQSPDEYIAALVGVFKEVWRVLRNDGVCWLNLGDSFFAHNGSRGNKDSAGGDTLKGRDNEYQPSPKYSSTLGLKSKDLLMIPHRVAIALQADGWYVRMDVVWSKPNPIPESVTDRPTKSHEYVFLLSKSQTYYYNADAIKEPAIYSGLANQDASGFKDPRSFNGKHKDGYHTGTSKKDKQSELGKRTYTGFNERWDSRSEPLTKRNRRSVWTVATKPYAEAHFATFPPDLIRPCILAGCPAGGVVLDPFAGSGTTLQVAMEQGCRSVGIELNESYCELIKKRMRQPMMNFADAG
jgi:DNA modification methylase